MMCTFLREMHKIFFYISLPIILYTHASMFYYIGPAMVLIYTLYLVFYFYITLQSRIQPKSLLLLVLITVILTLFVLSLPEGQFWQATSISYSLMGLIMVIAAFSAQRFVKGKGRAAYIFFTPYPLIISGVIGIIILMVNSNKMLIPEYEGTCPYFLDPALMTIMLTFTSLAAVYYFFSIKASK